MRLSAAGRGAADIARLPGEGGWENARRAGLRSLLKRWLFDADILRLMGLTLLVKPLGLATQMIAARLFGAGAEYDAYALGFFLVTCLDNVVGAGFNTVVLPLTIKLRGRLSPPRLLGFQNMAALLFLVPVLLYLLVLLGRHGVVVSVVAPGLSPQARSVLDRMLPWMVVPGLALTLVTMGKTLLNANRRYAVAGAMPLVGAAITLTILVLAGRQVGIWALPAGFFAANLVQIAIIAIYAFRTGVATPARPVATRPLLGELWGVGWVFLLSQVILLIGQSADRFFATGLEVGSLSALAYSSSIMNMGTQLFSMSLSVVMFTRITELLTAGAISECNRYLAENLGRQSRLVVPASLALCLASHEIVSVLFRRGAFDLADAERTSGVLAMYVIGLPAMVSTTMMARVYHSMQRMRDRVWLNAQLVGTTVTLSWLLIGSLQVRGLGVASSLAFNAHLALSLLVLHRYRVGLQVVRFGAIILRAYAAALATYGTYVWSGFGRGMDALSADAPLAGQIGVGAGKAAFVFAVFALFYLLGRPLARAGAGSVDAKPAGDVAP